MKNQLSCFCKSNGRAFLERERESRRDWVLARQKNHGHFGQSTGTTTAIAIEPGTQKASHTSAPAFAWPMAVVSVAAGSW